MSMTDWVKGEIEIACEKERGGEPDNGEWDYGCACYMSALNAYESLMRDGHSGFSIKMTQHILNRLIDGKPLTPIEDTEDMWNEVGSGCEEYRMYQCKRMSSLFKDVYADGTVKYSDVDRVYCVDIHNPSNTYSSSLVRRIINEMFPITMPYMPENKSYKAYCEDLLTDPKNGDFDTVGIFDLVKPDGEKVEINRFFKESSENESGWKEITEAEYRKRKHKDEIRRFKLKRHITDEAVDELKKKE